MRKICILFVVLASLTLSSCGVKEKHDVSTNTRHNTVEDNSNEKKPEEIIEINDVFISDFEKKLKTKGFIKEDNTDKSDTKFELNAKYTKSQNNLNSVIMIKKAKESTDINNLETFESSKIIDTTKEEIKIYLDETPRFSILSILDVKNKNLIVMQVLTSNKEEANKKIEEYKSYFSKFIK